MKKMFKLFKVYTFSLTPRSTKPCTYSFSTTSIIRTDKETSAKKLTLLKEERDSLENDLYLIKDAVRAASKIGTGEIPTEEEKECLDELKENYPSFFDSDEDEDEENKTTSLTKVMTVKRYITNEIRANKESVYRINNLSTPLVDSTQKEKAESSLKEKSSDKSPSDYIDDIPPSPFDDTGLD